MTVLEKVSKTGIRRATVDASPPTIGVSCRASATACPPLAGASASGRTPVRLLASYA